MSALLQGKVAVVSGVGPGLGSQIALALARHGAKVALGARSIESYGRVDCLVNNAAIGYESRTSRPR